LNLFHSDIETTKAIDRDNPRTEIWVNEEGEEAKPCSYLGCDCMMFSDVRAKHMLERHGVVEKPGEIR